jgi:hypothetical protein
MFLRKVEAFGGISANEKTVRDMFMSVQSRRTGRVSRVLGKKVRESFALSSENGKRSV